MRCLATAVILLSATGVHAALLGRAPLTAGGADFQAYYDDVLNITWLADANLALTRDFGVPGICTELDCPTSPGAMTWDVGEAYIAAMNAAYHLGLANWRLPDGDVNRNGRVVECNSQPQNEFLCRDNELSYHYFQNGISSGLPGPFANINSYVGVGYYGSGTEYSSDPSRRYFVNFGFPLQGLIAKSGTTYVWPVTAGDPLAVPIPAVGWFIGGAMGLLTWMRQGNR